MEARRINYLGNVNLANFGGLKDIASIGYIIYVQMNTSGKEMIESKLVHIELLYNFDTETIHQLSELNC